MRASENAVGETTATDSPASDAEGNKRPATAATESRCPKVTGNGRSLRHLAAELVDRVAACLNAGDDQFAGLPHSDDCVFIKNTQGVMVYANDAHREFFSPTATPLGRTGHAFLDESIIPMASKTDELIIGGCQYAECEHTGRGGDGRTYRLRTHKRSLHALGEPGLAVLGVTRLLSVASDPVESTRLDLALAAERFRGLAERDQEICRLTALGVSSRELGERVGMTTRGIELRKQKAFAHLGVAKAVDLARLLVRLQDHGHFDLGL